MTMHPDVLIVRSLLNAIDDECADGEEWQFMPHALAALDRIETALAGINPEQTMPMPSPLPTSPVTERELALKSVAPRVTAEDIENAIERSFYFTAHEGVLGEIAIGANGDIAPDAYQIDHPPIPESLRLLTICVLVLRNGFTVVGTSACASPANFDAGIGQRVARQDAIRQVWPLLGYQLRDRLAFDAEPKTGGQLLPPCEKCGGAMSETENPAGVVYVRCEQCGWTPAS